MGERTVIKQDEATIIVPAPASPQVIQTDPRGQVIQKVQQIIKVVGPVPRGIQGEDAAQEFSATCLAADLVGRPVFMTGTDAVATCDPTDFSKMVAVGVIVSKQSSTSCIVRTGGEVSGLSGLIPGERYWVALDGTLTEVVPTPPVSGKVYVQAMGMARTASVLVLQISPTLTRLEG